MSVTEIDIKGKGKYDFEFGEPVKDYPIPPSITTFNVSKNRFIELPDALKNTHLKVLKAEGNAIEYLPCLPVTTEEIHMGHNALKSNSFSNIKPHFTNLRILKLNNNRMLANPLMLYMETLTHLNISNNFITDFYAYPPHLVHLNISNNRITNIPKNIPDSITHFYIEKNKIKKLPDSIMECHNLIQLDYQYNRNITVSEPVLIFINERMEQRRMQEVAQEAAQAAARGQAPRRRHVYKDTQSVHASDINKSVRDNIILLQKQFNSANSNYNTDTLFNQYMNEFSTFITNQSYVTRLREICMKAGIHSILKLTIKQIFILVWHKIRTFDTETQEEISNIIKQDIHDLERVCFTGRISRLVNVLTGFTDDIHITIDMNSQIQAKYEVVKIWLDKCSIYNTDNIYPICFKTRFKTLLTELELEQELLEVWLEPFNIQPLSMIDCKRVEFILTDEEYAEISTLMSMLNVT